jgi:hypothetical protein
MVFKNGKFKMHNYSQNSDYIIERMDSLQLETKVKTGFVMTERVIWNSPCQYDLQELGTTNPHPEIGDSFFRSHPIHVNIIATSRDYYVALSEIKIGVTKIASLTP